MADFRRVAFHENVWLAVSASAPVIALANLVAVSDSMEYSYIFRKPRLEAATLRDRFWATFYNWLASFTYYLANANLMAQALVLGFALISLTDSSDSWSPNQIVYAEFFGILLCCIPVITSSMLRTEERRRRTKELNSRRPRPAHPVRTTSYRPRPPAWQRRNERLRAQARSSGSSMQR